MKKISILVIWIILIPVVFAGSVTRSFSKTNPCRNEEFDVTLSVDVTGETYYVIDEMVPSGFEVINSGGGDSKTYPPHIYWTVFFQYAQDTAYTYTIKASNYVTMEFFSGSYGLEGNLINPIGGTYTVNVLDCVPEGDLNQRVTLLEQWKTTVESWLKLLSYNNLCEAVGACGGSTVEYSCIDSDGSDIYTRGTVTLKENGQMVEQVIDYCSFDSVYEFTCYSDSSWLRTEVFCPQGYACQDGKCSEQEPGICRDNDDCQPIYYNNTYCLFDEVYTDVANGVCIFPWTPESHCLWTNISVMVQNCDDQGEYCEDGICKPIGGPHEVIFRTNSANNWDFNTWIAVDSDANGDLDGHGWKGSYTGCPALGWGTDYTKLPYTTPIGTGGNYEIYIQPGKVGICQGSKFLEFRVGYGKANSAQLTKESLEPYTSKGQEVDG
ncbi:MAG: hypothetical protein ABIG95_05105 [Candidatus Woesearchaeota archaeon]